MQIHNLVRKPELNGQRGTLHKFDIALERWQVYMSEGRGAIKIRPDNLRISEPSPTSSQTRSPIDAFSHFDTAGKGSIELACLGDALLMGGWARSDLDLRRLLAEAMYQFIVSIDFPDFMHILATGTLP